MARIAAVRTVWSRAAGRIAIRPSLINAAAHETRISLAWFKGGLHTEAA
jgi:hypothetical protein